MNELTDEKPKRGAIQDSVLKRLRHGLMVGALVPGQVISIRKLAAIMGTSPMPVRDALAQLVAANALEEMANRSVRVPILSRERIGDLFDARLALETMLIARACDRPQPELADELRAINDQITDNTVVENFHHLLELNQAFHFRIYSLQTSEVILPLVESLWLQCGPTLYSTLATPNFQITRDQHDRMVKAIRTGSPELAVAALTQEITNTRMTLLAQFDRNAASNELRFSDLSGLPLAMV